MCKIVKEAFEKYANPMLLVLIPQKSTQIQLRVEPQQSPDAVLELYGQVRFKIFFAYPTYLTVTPWNYQGRKIYAKSYSPTFLRKGLPYFLLYSKELNLSAAKQV